MTVTEQVAKAANATIDALKSTPLLLVLLLFNLLFMAMLAWITMKHSSQLNEEVDRWAKLAASCLPQRP